VALDVFRSSIEAYRFPWRVRLSPPQRKKRFPLTAEGVRPLAPCADTTESKPSSPLPKNNGYPT
jgi:hypothetical protein